MKQFANIQTDGGVEFDLARSGRLAKDLFGEHVMDDEESDHRVPEEWEGDEENDQKPIPPLKIVMLIVGTRGDVQPFIAIGKKLQVFHMDNICVLFRFFHFMCLLIFHQSVFIRRWSLELELCVTQCYGHCV